MENSDRKNKEIIENIIFALCSLILIKKDALEPEKIDDFIDKLSDAEKKAIISYSNDANNECIVRTTVEEKIKAYVGDYDSQEPEHPFAFDNSALTYQSFMEYFRDYYNGKNNIRTLPALFYWVFDEIKKASFQYHFVEKIHIVFYERKIDEIFENNLRNRIEAEAEEEAISQVKRQVEQQVQQVVAKATQDAKVEADKAEEKAEEAAKKAGEAVDKEMLNVTKHVSETSVTILGIFAAIVLTVVGGFIYSTAVFENLQTKDIDIKKLICVSSLVGFVCIALISAMFRFIANLSGKKVEKENNGKKEIDWYTVIICGTLLLIFVISCILQACSSNTVANTTENNTIDSESSVETSSVGTSEIVSDDELVGLQNDTSSETE